MKDFLVTIENETRKTDKLPETRDDGVLDNYFCEKCGVRFEICTCKKVCEEHK